MSGAVAAPRKFVWLVIGVVAMALFADSVNNGFVLDDQWIVEKNQIAHSLSNVGQIFSTDYWAGNGIRGNLYRPAAILSYAANYTLFGPKPWSYHLVNVLLHAIVSVLAFILVRELGASVAIGFTAGLFFALLPIPFCGGVNAVGRAETPFPAGAVGGALGAHRI